MGMKKVMVGVLAAAMVFSACKMDVDASLGVGEVDWVHSSYFPDGWVTHYVGDKSKAPKKRISQEQMYTSLPGYEGPNERGPQAYRYDVRGNLKTFRGAGWTLVYDKKGKLIKRKYGESGIDLYEYDGDGNMIRDKRYSSGELVLDLEYTYKSGKIYKEYVRHSSAKPETVGLWRTFKTDKNGNILSAKSKSGFWVKFEYDNLGRLLSYTNPTQKMTYQYDEDGYLVRQDYGYVYTLYTYETVPSKAKK